MHRSPMRVQSVASRVMAARPPCARGRNASPRPACMRFGHAPLSVFVGEDRSSCGVKRRVVIGMVEVPVGVDDVFQWSVAKAIESLFDLGPGGRNESVHDEFAVGAV